MNGQPPDRDQVSVQIGHEYRRLNQLARAVADRQRRGMSVDQHVIDEIATLKANIRKLRGIA